MPRKYLALMCTDSVCRAQERYYGQRMTVAGASERDPLEQAEIDFIAARDSFYLGTVSENEWPYDQHRGGPEGFLRVINQMTRPSLISGRIGNC